jgi:hypothetical protein
MQAVAALSRLQHLNLKGLAVRSSVDKYTPAYADNAFAPLAKGLQPLTELHIDPVWPAQLLQLPPKLQQLHITLRGYSVQDVQQLLEWLPSHTSILSGLQLDDWPGYYALDDELEEWAAALSTLATAFAAASAAAAAATAESAAADGSWRLASLSVLGVTRAASAAPLLRSLPADSLTYLACDVVLTRNADVNALCSLTALRHLRLQDRHLGGDEEDEEDEDGHYHPRAGCMHMVLAPLSALQQLTRLELSAASSLQLQQLQLPRLQHLVVDYLKQYGPGFPQLLGDLTSLAVLDLGGCCGLSAAAQLAHAQAAVHVRRTP